MNEIQNKSSAVSHVEGRRSTQIIPFQEWIHSVVIFIEFCFCFLRSKGDKVLITFPFIHSFMPFVDSFIFSQTFFSTQIFIYISISIHCQFNLSHFHIADIFSYFFLFNMILFISAGWRSFNWNVYTNLHDLARSPKIAIHLIWFTSKRTITRREKKTTRQIFYRKFNILVSKLFLLTLVASSRGDTYKNIKIFST